MYYPTYQQNADEQQYHAVKESLKSAMNMFDHLRPDQQRRLLQELMQEKALEELWRRMQTFYSGQ